MKYLKSLVVLIFIFALPIGSWLFLQSGLDWRRVKATELVDKGSFLDQISMTTEDKILVENKLKGWTSLIKLHEPTSSQDAELIRQFEDAFTFQWIESATGFTTPINGLEQLSYDYILVDTSMNIRQYYNGSDNETLTKIVEDIALMIPHRKSKDIKLKRTKDK